LLYVGATMRDKEKQSFTEQVLEDRVGGLNTLNELLVDYNYHIRPSVDKNLPLQINVSIHVLNVEWKADKLTLLYSICQSWNDDRLIFKGYKEIRFPYMKIIWMPDLYSPMETSKNILNSGYVSVTPNGEVRLRQRILTEQPCLLTVQKVVEDDGKLNCTWIAKSYQHNADELQLYLENVVTLNDDLQGRAIAYSSEGFHDTVNTSTGQHYRIKCIVQTYLSWLNDSDYNDSCYFCFKPLSSGDLETVRLLCLHLFHWDCLDKWALSLPANTAPAGYKCPECGERILPKSNQVSPVADCLKNKLITARWAERRCNIKKPLEPNGEVYNLPEMKTVIGCNARVTNVADSVNSSNNSWQKTNDEENYYQGDLITTTTSSTELLIDNNVENKYHRKSGNCTVAHNLIPIPAPDVPGRRAFVSQSQEPGDAYTSSEIDPCERQLYRTNCPSKSTGKNQSSQFVLRYYRRGSQCVSYPYGLCSATDPDESKLFKTRQQCQEYCLSDKTTPQSNQANTSPVVNIIQKEAPKTTPSPQTTFTSTEQLTHLTTTINWKKQFQTAKPIKSKCEQKREEGLLASRHAGSSKVSIQAAFIPECLPDGSYQPIQCDIFSLTCWCVDQDGIEKTGSRVTGGNRPNCNDSPINGVILSLHSSCLHSPERGPCNSELKRWYYDPEERQCKEMIYSGCGGNENNFISKDDCQRRCGTVIKGNVCPNWSAALVDEQGNAVQCYEQNCPIGYKCVFADEDAYCCANPQTNDLAAPLMSDDDSICKFPKDRGPCGSFHLRFYYDSAEQECRYFFYGGCGGNRNNFQKLVDCQNLCMKATMSGDVAKALAELEKTAGTPVVPPDVDNKCEMPKDPGPCRGHFERWYYDQNEAKCKPLIYGGCGGNANNFESLIGCQETCTELDADVCKHPADKGSCMGNFQRWHFDYKEKQCKPFLYGGCLGNGNNFQSRNVCEAKCMPETATNIEQTPSTTPPATTKSSTTKIPTVLSLNRCFHPLDAGTCGKNIQRWYYDDVEEKCKSFAYTGCGGNGNNFATREDCDQNCPTETTTQMPRNPCLHPKDPGTCNEHHQRWFFDNASQSCQQFTYGGCGGNGNNFKSHSMCMAKCGPALPENPCNHPPDRGDCSGHFVRFFYDYNAEICKQFIYGGCTGNGNNFATQFDCEQKCMRNKISTQTTTAVPAVHSTQAQPKPIKAKLLLPGDELCNLQKARGHCNSYELRYYFNRDAGRCEFFFYSGCGGNKNNFKTLAQCELFCSKKPAVPLQFGSADTSSTSETNGQPSYVNSVMPPASLEGYGVENQPTTFYPHQKSSEQVSSDVESSSRAPASNPQGLQSRPGFAPLEPGTETSSIAPAPPAYGDTLIPKQSLPGTVPQQPGTSFQQMPQPPSSTVLQSVQEKTHPHISVTPQPPSTPYQSPSQAYSTNYASEVGQPHENIQGIHVSTVYSGLTEGLSSAVTSGTPTAALRHKCDYPQERGPCSDALKRWYWDKAVSRCLPFTYGGCRGNSNNFETEHACIAECQGLPPNVCDHPLDKGSCDSKYQRWYFERNSNSCRMFEYGGCDGNGNNFASEAECRAVCLNGRPAYAILPPAGGAIEEYIKQTYAPSPQPNSPSSLGVHTPTTILEPEKPTVENKTHTPEAGAKCEKEVKCLPDWVMTIDENGCERCTYPTPSVVQTTLSPSCVPVLKCPEGMTIVTGADGCKKCVKEAPIELETPVPELTTVSDKPCAGDEIECEDMCMQITDKDGCVTCFCPQDKVITTSTTVVTVTDAVTTEPTQIEEIEKEEKPECQTTMTLKECPPHCMIVTNNSGCKSCLCPEVTEKPTYLIVSPNETRPIDTDEIREKCYQPLDRGPCFGPAVLRWWYNSETRKCERFDYSSCGGNRNHFYSQKECIAHCESPLNPVVETVPTETTTTAENSTTPTVPMISDNSTIIQPAGPVDPYATVLPSEQSYGSPGAHPMVPSEYDAFTHAPGTSPKAPGFEDILYPYHVNTNAPSPLPYSPSSPSPYLTNGEIPSSNTLAPQIETYTTIHHPGSYPYPPATVGTTSSIPGSYPYRPPAEPGSISGSEHILPPAIGPIPDIIQPTPSSQVEVPYTVAPSRPLPMPALPSPYPQDFDVTENPQDPRYWLYCPDGEIPMQYKNGTMIRCLPGQNMCPLKSRCYFNGLDYFCCSTATYEVQEPALPSPY
ncbi:Papilin, partial [Trichinella britovi]